MTAFARRPFQTPPPYVVDQFANRDPQRGFVAAGPFDVAAEAIQLGTEAAGVPGVVGIRRHADRTKPLDTTIQDVLDAGHRLDVVDDGRLAEHAFDGGKRRLDPRPRPLAFETLNQSGFFAADVGRRTAMQVDVQVIATAQNVLAQVARRVAFVDRLLQPR